MIKIYDQEVHHKLKLHVVKCDEGLILFFYRIFLIDLDSFEKSL